MTLDDAFKCVASHAKEHEWPDRERAREIELGWYFPWQFPDDNPRAGSKGLIVDKRTGKVVMLGSAYTLERDLKAHDAGYPLNGADLIVTSVSDQDRTVRWLLDLQVSKVEPEEEGGVIWRISKLLSRFEIQAKLSTLPADFGKIGVYFLVEELEEAKREGCFSFELKS
jgi:hypothetical protein